MSSDVPTTQCSPDTRTVCVGDGSSYWKAQKNGDKSVASEGLESIEEGELLDTTGSNISQNSIAFSSDNDKTVISSADETVIEKRSWKNIVGRSDTLEEGEVRSDDDRDLNTEMYSSFIYTTIDRTNCTVVAAEADSTNNEIGDTSLQRKRKRSLSDVGNEFTPKHLKLQQLHTNDETVSPIDFIVRSVDSVKTCIAEAEETPIIDSKFECSINADKILNSTPIAKSHLKNREVKKVIRKSMFRNIESDEVNDKGFQGFIDKQPENIPSGENKTEIEENVSKIDISIFTNESVSDNELCSGKPVDSETSSDKQGRFKDVEANITTTEDIEFEDMTEDILGLEENESDEIQHIESDNDKTLVAEECVIQLIAVESETEKEKESHESKEAKEDHLKREVDKAEVCVSEHGDQTDESKQTISTTTDTINKAKADRIKQISMSAVDHKLDFSQDVDVQSGMKQKAIEESVRLSVITTNNEPVLDVSLFDTSQCRLEDANKLMTIVRKRWDSHGVPSPDTNLTAAVTFRRNNKDKGLQEIPGVLEGEKLCCIDLHDDAIDMNNNMNTETKIQPNQQTLVRLQGQLKGLEWMKCLALRKIKQKFTWLQDDTNYRLNREMRRLNDMQARESRQLMWDFHLPRDVKEHRLKKLDQEHNVQCSRLENRYQQEHRQQLAEEDNVLQQEDAKHQERLAPIQRLIRELEKSQHTVMKTEKYGPLVTVTLKKAPCKANYRKFTAVNVCLPAAIAQAVSQEDGIMDHFYSY